jgi:hypothetical protein
MSQIDLLHHAMRDRGLATTCDPHDHDAASAQVSGDAYMSGFNWRSSAGFYNRVEGAEMTGLAWECLRRNRAFQQNCRTALQSGTSVGTEFRENWGLVFRS